MTNVNWYLKFEILGNKYMYIVHRTFEFFNVFLCYRIRIFVVLACLTYKALFVEISDPERIIWKVFFSQFKIFSFKI